VETTADQVRSLVMALAVHALIVLVIALGLMWTRSVRPVQAAGPIIEATLVNMATPSLPRPKSVPKPQPKPEEKPADQKQAPVPPKGEEKETQEQIDRMALEKAQKADREQKEKIAKQQQVLEQEQTKMDIEKRKQLEDIRKRLEAAEKKRALEQEKLAQLEDLAKHDTKPQPPAPPQPPARAPGAEGLSDELLARYTAAIQSVVTTNWLRPDSAQPGLSCALEITQIVGGEVIEVHVVPPCNADDITRRSIEAAVQRAQPLPYQGYEKVFQRKIRFNFHYDG
jgi:colicin import membrane protein